MKTPYYIVGLFASLCAILLPSFAFAALPPGFEIETVTGGLTLPTSATFAADGRIFIAEKDGTVVVVKNGVLLPTPVIHLTDVNSYGDRGLIGIATDPNFLQNGYLYLNYTHENTPGTNFAGPKTARIVRVKVIGDVASESTKIVLVGSVGGDINTPSCQNFPVTADCVPSDSLSHSSGGLRFGPDGKLYASLGEGSGFDGVDQNAFRSQNIDSLGGKILRINTDGSAPTDNPFYNGDPTANRSKVYAYGVRQMYRFNFKPITGELYGGDVGWNSWEEIDLIKAGANYGWPCHEGALQTVGYNCSIDGATLPLYYYGHNASGAGSVTSGAFPSGSAYPSEYANTFFFGDFAQNWIKTMTLTPTGAVESVKDFASGADGSNGPVEFVTGPEGNVYFIAIYKGQLKRITHTLGNRKPIVVMDAAPRSGLAPLAVNFFSDGTNDPDGDPVTYDWNFGDGMSSADMNPMHVYMWDGNFTAVLTVRDNRGGVQSKSLNIQVGNRAPHVAVTSPKDGSFYVPGKTLTLSGVGTDPEDGVLPDAQLSWRVILHHNTHIHILESHIGKNNFTITAPEHSDPSVYTEIELTGTDSAGLTDTASINIYLNNSAAEGSNLIKNPSFEKTDPLNPQLPDGWNGTWWGNLGPIFTYPVEGYEGSSSRAAKLQLTQYVEGDAKWGFSPVFVSENTLYSFSDHYYSSVPSSAVLQVGYPNGTFQYTVLANIPPSSTWKEFATTFTTPPNARTVSIFHELTQVGTLTVDAYSLTQGTSTVVIPPPVATTTPTNLIKNPSLENADVNGPIGWSQGSWGVNTPVFTYQPSGFNSQRSGKVQMTAYTDGDAKWYFEPVPVTPGTVYTFTDFYKADTDNGMTLEYTLADGTLVYEDLGAPPVAADWTMFTARFTPPALAVSATVYHSILGVGTLSVDGYAITPA